MRAIEALQRLVEISSKHTHEGCMDIEDLADDEAEELKNDQVAVAIVQAMLNTAIPIARFRIHAEFVGTGKKNKIVDCDYTVCGTSIPSVKAAINQFKHEEGSVYISLWEQHPDRAEMVNAYQGPTQSQNFRNWLRQLDAFEFALPTNMQ